jgi:hypothetical protein
VYIVIAGMHWPAWHRPPAVALQHVVAGPHAPPFATHAAAVAAHAPPESTPEQHCDALVAGNPLTRHVAPLAGVADVHATNNVPSAHAAPL